MGFSFKPFKAITRAVGIPDKVATVILPGVRLAEEAANAAINYTVNKVVQPQGKGAATGLNVPYPGGNYNVYHSGYGPPPAYSVYFQEEGRHTPWDFSTDLSETSPEMYSETSWRTSPLADSWETRFKASLLNR